MALRRPKASASIPVGISSSPVAISRMENKAPIWRNERPASRKNKIKKGSKNRRFFRKPYRRNL